MANITAKLVKELRDKTGLGMMDCKKALTASDGDIDLAIDNLRKSSALKAAKKSERISSEGVAKFIINDSNNCGYLIEVNSETDFVARDSNFLSFVDDVLQFALNNQCDTVEQLQSDDSMQTKKEQLIQKLGENIAIRRLTKIAGETVAGYTHLNSKISVLVAMASSTVDICKDVAMHVAAFNPMVVDREQMDQNVIAKERQIFQAQAKESGKPANIIDKIVEGQVQKFLSENCLIDQSFVKDDKVKVKQFIGSGQILQFQRYSVGEGIEKKVVSFADEVAEQLK